MNRLLRKILMNGIVLVPLLIWFSEATFLTSLIAALVLSGIAYIVGDQLVLRRSNNLVATLTDGVLAFVYLWVVADWLNWNLTFGEIFLISLVLGVVEFIYHRQLGEADAEEQAS
ncbi:MAG: DUF2512 family protein [Bacillaceae bacterium]|nr:DUF2512 family protein [Bacillaceae bacterium]